MIRNTSLPMLTVLYVLHTTHEKWNSATVTGQGNEERGGEGEGEEWEQVKNKGEGVRKM